MTSEQESEEIKRVEFSAEVEASWHRFKKIYSKNQYVIENRWIKMKQSLQRDLMNKNWRSSGNTSMPQEHRPDLTQLVPWRDPLNKDRSLIPPRVVDHNYLQWPTFNLFDLTNSTESFLQLLYSRANEHPKDFSHLDHFRENETIALVEGLFVKWRQENPPEPMARIHTIETNDEDGDLYGSIVEPSDQEDFNTLRESRLWLAKHATQLMVIQHRIYQFLEGVVTDIMSVDNEDQYRVDEEHLDPQWRLQLPKDELFEQDFLEFSRQRSDYMLQFSNILPYTSTTHDTAEYAIEICAEMIGHYSYTLQSLKSRPDLFYQRLYDIREHSHHMVKYNDGRTHSWADLDGNEDNDRMWAEYLMKALHTVTEGVDAWTSILDTFEQIQNTEIASGERKHYTVLLYNALRDRMRLGGLKDTLACSKPLRQYFRNEASSEDAHTVKLRQSTSTKDINNAKVASLVSLLRVITEPIADQYIPVEKQTWTDEIILILYNDEGERWMTDYGFFEALENRYVSELWLLFKRIWDYNGDDLLYNPEEQQYKEWENYRPPSDTLAAIDTEDWVRIVKEHMLPSPQNRFDYPDVLDTQTRGKRRHNASIRRESEKTLKALWADLQPFLEMKEALSANSIMYLNGAIPTATRPDGVDATPSEPPSPLQPPAPAPGAAGPSTPPPPSGTSETAAPVTPLRGLSIKSPPNRTPPVKTPERKTANDGVKKPSPIRPARPGEGGPRRPQIDLRAQRAILAAAAAAAAEPAPIVVAAPPAAPPVDREYPKIELPKRSFDLVERLMKTSVDARQTAVPWNDMLNLFKDCGFEFEKRPRGGGSRTFSPSAELRESQGIEVNISKDEPHGRGKEGGKMPFYNARDFLRGQHGFGKYGWTFDKFTLRPAKK